MTPLAHHIVKDMTLPVRRRTFQDEGGLLPHFREEFHCFEVSQVFALARGLVDEMLHAALPSVKWSFLPAHRTWLEWKDRRNDRVGAMLINRNGFAEVLAASESHSAFGGGQIGHMALSDELSKLAPSPLGWSDIESAIFRNIVPSGSGFDLHDGHEINKYDRSTGLMWWLYAYLLLINTPRVINRQTHDPHRGLARHILANRKTLGIFPLQAWTEITLKTETIDASDEEPRSSQLSGSMPLHWTRAHKRRVHGIWTLINDYWSGDGSLGIKQSRYKLVPAEQAE